MPSASSCCQSSTQGPLKQINSPFPLSLFSWPAAPSHLHRGFINSDHVIPMLMAFNEIEGRHAFPFNTLGAAIPFHAMVSIQCSWKERWDLAHPSHSPCMCCFQHGQERKEGNHFVVSLIQETHPSPTDRHCTTRAACDTGKKQNKQL